MNEDIGKKRLWMKPAMNGDDNAVMQALLNTLPSSESLDTDGLKQLETARDYMAELFLRGITYSGFIMATGMTGFPVYPSQPGMENHKFMGETAPIYYRFWLLDKDPLVSAAAIKNTLLFRRDSMPEEYRGWYALQLTIDVENDDKNDSFPLEQGLTRHAVCLEVGLGQVEEVFASIEKACAKLSKKAHHKLRFSLGSFAQQEYEGIGNMKISERRMPFRMGSEWMLFKNIQRRAARQAKSAR